MAFGVSSTGSYGSGLTATQAAVGSGLSFIGSGGTQTQTGALNTSFTGDTYIAPQYVLNTFPGGSYNYAGNVYTPNYFAPSLSYVASGYAFGVGNSGSVGSYLGGPTPTNSAGFNYVSGGSASIAQGTSFMLLSAAGSGALNVTSGTLGGSAGDIWQGAVIRSGTNTLVGSLTISPSNLKFGYTATGASNTNPVVGTYAGHGPLGEAGNAPTVSPAAPQAAYYEPRRRFLHRNRWRR